MPPRQDSKANGLAWVNADHSVDQFKAFALVNGWPPGGTNKAAIKASLQARVNALGAGDQVWIPPDPAAPVPGPAPVHAPAPAHAPAPGPAAPTPTTQTTLEGEAGDGLVELWWTPVTGVTTWEIWQRSTGDYRRAWSGGSQITRKVIKNLHNDQPHKFYVRGFNSAGNWKDSNVLPLTPAAPATQPATETREGKSVLDGLNQLVDEGLDAFDRFFGFKK